MDQEERKNVQAAVEAAIKGESPVQAEQADNTPKTPPTESKTEGKAEFSEVEREAMEQGWKPDGPKSAEQFISDGSYIKKIKNYGKKLQASDEEIASLNATVAEMKKFMDQQRELGYQQAMKELQRERKAAEKEGDAVRVQEIDREMQEAQPLPAETQAFLERHASWLSDPSYEAEQMREFAKKRDAELTKFNLSLGQIAEQIDKDLEVAFPKYFKKEVQEQPIMAVESDSTPRKTRKTAGYNDLSPIQKDICNKLEKSGAMTREQYIENLKLIGDL